MFFTEQVRETTGTGAARIAPRSGRAAGAPVVDVAERILDERLILVVAPLPVDDKFILVVSGGQVAHHRENLGARGGGLGGHGDRLQPVGEGPAQVHLGGRKREEGEGRVSESRVARGDASVVRPGRRPGIPVGNVNPPEAAPSFARVEAQTRTCLPPYAHTNRVGNTICSYIACCAIGADPPSRGTSVPPTAVVVVVQRTQLRGGPQKGVVRVSRTFRSKHPRVWKKSSRGAPRARKGAFVVGRRGTPRCADRRIAQPRRLRVTPSGVALAR